MAQKQVAPMSDRSDSSPWRYRSHSAVCQSDMYYRHFMETVGKCLKREVPFPGLQINIKRD